ncbi:beta-1,6-N-acetylglucosaminyltransferase [Fontibacter flavus]|uniref:Peptide O-xylosyltransferase n=1 Tax=Fontibacter flavus TaxID=654838 RepID=A0ABV6FRU1_9BACT
MKKHAVLLLAHQNLVHLKQYIEFLGPNFFFYIHINKKAFLTDDEIEELKSHPNVRFISRKYLIRWGGTRILKAILELAQVALKDDEYAYLHTASGQDFPIKRSEEILKFFHLNQGKEFIEYFPVPTERWDNGGLDRYQFYHLYDLFNVKSRFGKFMIRLTLKFQKIFGIKRGTVNNLPSIYGGSCWFSITGNCMKYCLDFLSKNPKILDNHEYVFGPEESFFQTIIMNSPYKESVVNDNLFYIDWEFRNGNSPAVLDQSDWKNLLNSDKLFGRKFQSPTSDKLKIDLMEKLNISNSSEILEK